MGEARAVALYAQFIAAEVRSMGSSEAAELTKLAETTYRDLNIAYANELARYADRLGLDVQRVIDAANSQPYSHVHRPGVAVGGHCIPVYPHFLLSGDPAARLPRVGREVNSAMPAYAVDLLAGELGDLGGRTILILGVAYRGGVKEHAFSGAAALRDELLARGARALASDPMYSGADLAAAGYEPWSGRARRRRDRAGRSPRVRDARPRRRRRRDGRRRRPRGARSRGVRRRGRTRVADRIALAVSDLTVYEKRTCSKCRELDGLLAERGIDAAHVDYHVEGIDEATIRDLLAKAGIGPREALRVREPLVAELGLLDAGVSDDRLIALMAERPELLQRPIVVRGDRAVLARPVQRVLELLDD